MKLVLFLNKSNKIRPKSYRVSNRKYLHPRQNINDISFVSNAAVIRQSNPDDSLVLFRDENNISQLNKKIKNLKFKKGIKLCKPKVINIENLRRKEVIFI